MLANTEKNTGAQGNPGGRGARVVRSDDATAHTPTVAQMGLTKDESSRYQQLAAMPADHFETAVATAKATAGDGWGIPSGGSDQSNADGARCCAGLASFEVGTHQAPGSERLTALLDSIAHEAQAMHLGPSKGWAPWVGLAVSAFAICWRLHLPASSWQGVAAGILGQRSRASPMQQQGRMRRLRSGPI